MQSCSRASNILGTPQSTCFQQGMLASADSPAAEGICSQGLAECRHKRQARTDAKRTFEMWAALHTAYPQSTSVRSVSLSFTP